MNERARIYNAGVMAESVPYFVGMRTADIERLYTTGYMAHWAELDKDTEIIPRVSVFISNLLRDDPKMAADLAAYRAAVAAKR